MRRDPELRFKRLLTRVGAKVVTPDNLDQLPPPGATLVLETLNWDLFPEREAALQRWVEAGGTLVVPDFSSPGAGLGWVPIKRQPTPPRPKPGAADVPDERDTRGDADEGTEDDEPPRPRQALPRLPRCPGVSEPASVPPAFDTARSYATCLRSHFSLSSPLAPLWALDGANGHVVLRVPVGRGSVTASSGSIPWSNEDVLERDNALIAIAATRAQPGREVWIVSGESRPPLPVFLWERGAPAVLLGAAALAFGLWRGARRFGPRMASLPLARRSMAEQIRGTAHFIARRGSPALHAAQLRAVNDAARAHIRGFDAMTLRQRAEAIAALTRLDAQALVPALEPAPSPGRTRHLAPNLALLETARRRLVATPRGRGAPTESR
jgi:hypothetical protein